MNRVIHMPAAVRTVAGSAVAATAIAAAGFLTVSPLAQAHPMVPLGPPCSQYVFTGGFSIRQDNGWQTFFSSTGPTGLGGKYVGVYQDNVTKGTGTVSGGIQGTNNIDFTTHSTDGNTEHYMGTIGDDGLVHNGSGIWQQNGQTVSWDSINGPLGCNTPAAAPAPPPPLKIPESDSLTVAPRAGLTPAAAPAPAAKPLQGPTVSAKPGLTGVTFHVTDRSGVASQCTYSSEGFTSDSFSLPANGSFDLFIPALREFRNRTGTITCDNGTSAPTSVFF
jgi:hypothetical protein